MINIRISLSNTKKSKMFSTALFIGSTGYLTIVYQRYLDEARKLEKGEEVDGEQIKQVKVSEIIKLETDVAEFNPPTYLHIGTVAGIAFPLNNMHKERKSEPIYSHVKLQVGPEFNTAFTITNPTLVDCNHGTISYINTPDDMTNRYLQHNIDRTSLRLRLPLKLTHASFNNTQIDAYTNKPMNLVGFNAFSLSRRIAKSRINWVSVIPAAGLAAYSSYRFLHD